MKILRLELIAFGPFTERTLDFSSGNAGLHIVYGDNEAGKSSSLRALRDALFGIPERSADNFLHAYPKMRIGVEVSLDDGRTFHFLRRKGRDKTLLDAPTNTPVSESQLASLLGGIDRQTYESMFGVDHASLVAGGQQIAQFRGSIGQTLFSAAGGISTLRQTQADLEQQAQSIFAPRGAKPSLNEALNQFRDAKTRLRDAKIASKEFADIRANVERVEARLAIVERSLRSAKETLTHSEHIRDAIPLFARRDTLRAELGASPEIRELRADFAEEVRRSNQLLLTAKTSHDLDQQRLERLRAERSSLNLSGEILLHREEVRRLPELVGSFLKAQADLPSLRDKYESRRRDAGILLKQLRPDLSLDQAESLRLSKRQEIEIRNLGQAHSAYRTKMSELQGKVAEWTSRLREAESELQSAGGCRDVSEFKRALKRAAEWVSQERSWLETTRQRQRLEKELNLAIARLGYWSGSLDQLERLAVPSGESIAVHDQRLAEVEGMRGIRAREVERLGQERVALDGELLSLKAIVGTVPTDDDLRNVRARRDREWHKLKVFLESRQLETFPSRPFSEMDESSISEVAEKYERNVREADSMVDRLRLESQRFAEYAQLVSKRERLERDRERVAQQLAESQRDVEQAIQRWKELWQPLGLDPATPREMLDWRNRLAASIEERLPDFREAQRQEEELAAAVIPKRQRFHEMAQPFLADALEPNMTLEVGLRIATEYLEDEEARIRARKQLADRVERLKVELDQAQAGLSATQRELDDWKQNWGRVVTPLGLPQDAATDQVFEVLSQIREILELLKEADGADGFGERITGIERESQHFREEVVRLGADCQIAAEHQDAAAAAKSLIQKLHVAEATETRIVKLDHEIAELERKVEASRDAMGQQRAQLEALCQEAGCPAVDLLDAFAQQSDQARQLRVRLRDTEEGLARLANGQALDRFEQQARDADLATLPDSIAVLASDVLRWEEEHRQLLQDLGGLRTRLQSFDTGTQAIEASSDTEKCLVRIEEQATEYVRTRLAAIVLRRAIERFNERHQGPILRRAGEYFRHLSQGSFGDLRIDYDTGDEPVIVGIRARNQAHVPLEAMSEGAADQLYFALRLGYLDEWLERHDPLPLVIDDILIKFDEARCRATLHVLADFSRRTQVILFTHHQHVVELATRHLPSDVVFVHDLSGKSA